LALKVLDAFPSYSCELVFLDDCTMYVRVSDRNRPIADVYPIWSDDQALRLFVDLEGCVDEIRLATIDDLISVLRPLAATA
jgi:hypothetical protein